jgi:hypothetical protein
MCGQGEQGLDCCSRWDSIDSKILLDALDAKIFLSFTGIDTYEVRLETQQVIVKSSLPSSVIEDALKSTGLSFTLRGMEGIIGMDALPLLSLWQ